MAVCLFLHQLSIIPHPARILGKTTNVNGIPFFSWLLLQFHQHRIGDYYRKGWEWSWGTSCPAPSCLWVDACLNWRQHRLLDSPLHAALPCLLGSNIPLHQPLQPWEGSSSWYCYLLQIPSLSQEPVHTFVKNCFTKVPLIPSVFF